jgi:hypothetical protein
MPGNGDKCRHFFDDDLLGDLAEAVAILVEGEVLHIPCCAVLSTEETRRLERGSGLNCLAGPMQVPALLSLQGTFRNLRESEFSECRGLFADRAGVEFETFWLREPSATLVRLRNT